jgi:hypothetical protein
MSLIIAAASGKELAASGKELATFTLLLIMRRMMTLARHAHLTMQRLFVLIKILFLNF